MFCSEWTVFVLHWRRFFWWVGRCSRGCVCCRWSWELSVIRCQRHGSRAWTWTYLRSSETFGTLTIQHRWSKPSWRVPPTNGCPTLKACPSRTRWRLFGILSALFWEWVFLCQVYDWWWTWSHRFADSPLKCCCLGQAQSLPLSLYCGQRSHWR